MLHSRHSHFGPECKRECKFANPVYICLFHFSLVSYYTNWFGVYQFTGIITAPFVGLPMDWKPKKKQDEETDMGFIAGYVLTSFVALTLNILVLVPVLPVQVIAAPIIYFFEQ